jgi:hypothetical protein
VRDSEGERRNEKEEPKEKREIQLPAETVMDSPECQPLVYNGPVHYTPFPIDTYVILIQY